MCDLQRAELVTAAAGTGAGVPVITDVAELAGERALRP